jgi:hypothetical protein
MGRPASLVPRNYLFDATLNFSSSPFGLELPSSVVFFTQPGVCSSFKARCRVALLTHRSHYPPCGGPFGPSSVAGLNTPAADFCRPVRMDRSTLSSDSGTNGRSPEVSSTAFRTQPPDLQPVPLMDMGFAVNCQLARRRMPQIRFLYIGSYVCSTLLSDPPSPERPCASL